MPKYSPERTKARHEEIIDACEVLYQTMSFNEITLKDIGAKTTFTRTSIYNYFHTKEEIFLALLAVFQTLIDNGATVVVIEHDLDVIRNADYCIDMGPGGGCDGGTIVADGTPNEIACNEASITGRYI